MTPETHLHIKEKILQGLAETNAIHVKRNLSTFTAQLLTWKLFKIYFNGFCSCITIIYLTGILSPM